MTDQVSSAFGLSRVFENYQRKTNLEKQALCVGVACELVNSHAGAGGKLNADTISILTIYLRNLLEEEKPGGADKTA